MARFTKKILALGDYHAPNGVVNSTPEAQKHWAAQFAAMREAGFGIPVGWDHAPKTEDAVPVKMDTKRGPTKDTAGYLTDFRVLDDGQVEIEIDVPLEADAEKVRNNLAYVSPVIFGTWKDGSDRTWENVVTHVDLVQHPVDGSQTLFQEVAEPIACCLRMSLDGGKPELYKMAAEGETDPANNEPNPDMPADPAGRMKSEAIVGNLSQLGVELPSGFEFPENWPGCDVLLAALKTAASAAQKSEEQESAEDVMPTEEKPEFASMSLDLQRQQKFADKQYKAGLTRELEELHDTGRCTTQERDAQLQAMNSIKLSLDDNGSPEANSVSAFVEARKSLPEGAAWPSEEREKRLSLDVQEEPMPNWSQGGGVGREQAKEYIDSVAGSMPGAFRATASR